MGVLHIAGDYKNKLEIINHVSDLMGFVPFDVTYTVDELEVLFRRKEHEGFVSVRDTLDPNRMSVHTRYPKGDTKFETVRLDLPAAYTALASQILMNLRLDEEKTLPIDWSQVKDTPSNTI